MAKRSLYKSFNTQLRISAYNFKDYRSREPRELGYFVTQMAKGIYDKLQISWKKIKGKMSTQSKRASLKLIFFYFEYRDKFWYI